MKNVEVDAEVSVITPPGTGAVGIVRVTGRDAERIVKACIVTPDDENIDLSRRGRLRYGLMGPESQAIDDVLVSAASHHQSVFVDIMAHGGIHVMSRIVQLLTYRGARLRSPGRESTDTSSYPGALTDRLMAVARTGRAVRFLARQRQLLPQALAWISSVAEQSTSKAQEAIEKIYRRHVGATRLIHGTSLAIAGEPNAGKSTLFNRLIGTTGAVVSHRPGTTRDWVYDEIEIRGIAVDLVDTAGFRSHADHLEQMAIRSGLAQTVDAELVLLLLDLGCALDENHVSAMLKRLRGQDVLIVPSKSDLPPAWPVERLTPHGSNRIRIGRAISAITGDGMESMLNELEFCWLGPDWSDELPALLSDSQAKLVREFLTEKSRHKEPGLVARQLIANL
ncbi:MAG: GTPase [Planctomycetota bacterium]|jgi:tRNA modification GTPase